MGTPSKKIELLYEKLCNTGKPQSMSYTFIPTFDYTLVLSKNNMVQKPVTQDGTTRPIRRKIGGNGKYVQHWQFERNGQWEYFKPAGMRTLSVEKAKGSKGKFILNLSNGQKISSFDPNAFCVEIDLAKMTSKAKGKQECKIRFKNPE